MAKKITIITPCFNAEKYIAETVESVINQIAVTSGIIELEYIICDGGSTDRTVEIVKSFNHPSITILSEKDKGMYDALVKGLKMATGDICAYINAGDFYSKHAFGIVLKIFQGKSEVRWLTGMRIQYNEESQIIGSGTPFKYRSRFFLRGLYGRVLPILMQEGTFWDRKLNDCIDYEKLITLKLAGDYFIWTQFAKQTELKIVEAYLGGFKFHAGQLSENMDRYFKEVKPVCKKFIAFYNLPLIIFDFVMWYAPSKVKKWFNPNGLFRFSHKEQRFI